MMTLQEVLKSVDSLSIAHQAFLWDQLKMRLAQVETSTPEIVNKTRNHEEERRSLLRSLKGKYAHHSLSSEEFPQRKQEEESYLRCWCCDCIF
jgi:hypothetical protein